MAKKHFGLCILFFLCLHNIYAQLGGEGTRYGKNPNNFTPASPEATSFQRYGDQSVSYQRGLVDISIPLGVISLKGFSWPISLAYHSGGNKVGEIANSSGLGWTLNGYGIISSKVIGKLSFTDPERRVLNLASMNGTAMSMTNCAYYSEADIALAENVIAGGVEFLPDLTYTNTPLFNLKAVGGMIYPSTDIQGGVSSSPFNVTIEGIPYSFMAGYLDSRGVRYFFSDLGFSNSTNSTCNNGPLQLPNPNYMLSKVVTYEGEVLSFTYDTVTYSYNMPPTEYRMFAQSNQCQRCNYEIVGEIGNCNNIYSASEGLISKIESSNGNVVRFHYSNRSDLPNGKKLEYIEFKRKENGIEELLKKIVLVHSYFGSGNADDIRLKLSELKQYDKANNFINSYYFDYNSINLPNRVSSKAQDWFGYYNGAINNTSLLPYDAANNPQGGNRISSTEYAKASILEKITYPSGGFSSMEYERNPFGGLRIKSLKVYDGINVNPKTRVFNYHIPEGDGSNPGLAFEDYLVSNYFATEPSGFLIPDHESGGLYLLNCYTQRINSSPVTNTTMNLIIQNEDYYSNVTEYFRSDSANGKIEYSFGNTVNGTGSAFVPPVIQLLGKKIYKQNGNNYDLQKESLNEYEQIYPVGSPDIFAPPSAPFENRVWVKELSKVRDEMEYTSPSFHPLIAHWCKIFQEANYSISSMPVLLTKTTEKIYTPGSSMVLIDTVRYYYDEPTTMQPTRIKKTNSKGDSVIVKNIYPGAPIPLGVNLTANEQTALNTLYNKNIITTPFYTEWTNKGNLVQKSLITYQEIQGLALPKKEILYPSGGSNFEEYQFKSYDSRANLLDFQGKDNVNHSLLYDNNSNVLAHCVGAQNIETAYTSFETGISGNWSGIIYNNIINTPGVTGKKYYEASFSFSKSDLSSSEIYVISYWSQNSSYSVNSSLGIAGRTYNGWTYYEHKILNPAGGIITITGNGKIDELRLYPQKAYMTTYTYEPLIGINSKCDANNRISYNEYDAFNRLHIIRDQDNNILKKICYNYAGQVENCNSPCPAYSPPNWQNTTTPPTCQQSSCGNTGYQLQEQRDMNPCSQSYNLLQPIPVYNPSACPASGINITYNNQINTGGFTATYTHTTTSQQYSFTIPASGSGIVGCLPAGRYSLTISKPGNNMYILFGTGCHEVMGTSASFGSVSVTTCNAITLDWAY